MDSVISAFSTHSYKPPPIFGPYTVKADQYSPFSGMMEPVTHIQYSLSGKSGITLDWNRRLRIALGSGKGLAYLHRDIQSYTETSNQITYYLMTV
ncbi:unnamed protein product [Arabis nemorensis]|uniref:Protein kinase domain-containing protein n=1 Tax=Arabis nemorensis TaxID=586526 RepID=A0A565CP53_9BRAS|nr:unnamed protein product [Arabis nemorensis]